MTEQMNRRSLITGLVSLVAAPAIVRVSSIMPVKNMDIVTVIPTEMHPALGPPITYPDLRGSTGLMLDGISSLFGIVRKTGECDHNLRWRVYDSIVESALKK